MTLANFKDLYGDIRAYEGALYLPTNLHYHADFWQGG